MGEILEVLKSGGHIWYAPINGGLLLMASSMVRSKTKITTSDFLTLRDKGVIEFKSFMRQGHFLFHGRVDLYEMVASDNTSVNDNEQREGE